MKLQIYYFTTTSYANFEFPLCNGKYMIVYRNPTIHLGKESYASGSKGS